MNFCDQNRLPRQLRTINLSPATLRLLPMPADVYEMSQVSDIDVCRTGLDEMPLPLVDLVDWIGCYQAAPHSDPDWHGSLFITLAICANHTFETMVVPGQVVSLPVMPGTLFVFDPMLLHWLKPSLPLQETGFAALQWSVKRSEFPGHYRTIRKGLRALGGVKTSLVNLKDEGWRVSVPAQVQQS